MSAPDAPAAQKDAVPDLQPLEPAEVQTGNAGGVIGSGKYRSLDRATTLLGKTVGVQSHKKWAPLLVPQIFAPSATNKKVQCQWLPKYPTKELAALAYDVANVWRAIHGIAGVTPQNARFNFPQARYFEDSELEALLAKCHTFKELRGIIKFQLLPRTPLQARPATSPSKPRNAKPAKPQGIKPGCIRIILTHARLRDCRAYLKTPALREAFFVTGEGDDQVIQQIKRLEATAITASSQQQQTFLLPFGLPGRDGLPFVAANLKSLLEALGARPDDVLQLEYKGQDDGVVQVAASLLRASKPSVSGVAVPALQPLPSVAVMLPSHSGSAGPGSKAAWGQAGGGQHHGGAEAGAGVEGAAEAALLLGMRQMREVTAAVPEGVQAPLDGTRQWQEAAPLGGGSQNSLSGAAAATPASSSDGPASRKRRHEGGGSGSEGNSEGNSEGKSEPAAKRQALREHGGIRARPPPHQHAPPKPASQGGQPPPQQHAPPEPASQASLAPLLQLPPQPHVQPPSGDQAAAPGGAPLVVEASRSSPGALPGGGGRMQAASPTGGGAGTGSSSGMPAPAADVVQQALNLLAAAREADEQQQPRQHMKALLQVLRLLGVEHSLRTAYFDVYRKKSLEQQGQHVVVIHGLLEEEADGVEQVVQWVRLKTGTGAY